MQRSACRNTALFRENGRVHELKIGVGLNSGEVVVRSISSDMNIDYSAIGQSTYLAARMEEIAPPGSIRMTGTTLREVEGFVRVESLGSVPVKGFSNPIEAYALVVSLPSASVCMPPSRVA
jgi:class 3 adenylate cyclase